LAATAVSPFTGDLARPTNRNVIQYNKYVHDVANPEQMLGIFVHQERSFTFIDK